jgi:predicted transcriptional regulator
MTSFRSYTVADLAVMPSLLSASAQGGAPGTRAMQSVLADNVRLERAVANMKDKMKSELSAVAEKAEDKIESFAARYDAEIKAGLAGAVAGGVVRAFMETVIEPMVAPILSGYIDPDGMAFDLLLYSAVPLVLAYVMRKNKRVAAFLGVSAANAAITTATVSFF